MNYTFEDLPEWLTVSPIDGVSTGPAEENTHTLTVDSTALQAGDYSADVTLASSSAVNSPRTLAVTLTVIDVSDDDEDGFLGGITSAFGEGEDDNEMEEDDDEMEDNDEMEDEDDEEDDD